MADSVTFHFDPVCPWTWLSSRWVLEVADQTGLEVTWQSFSLPLLNEGKEIPEQFQAGMEVSKQATRVVQHLADAGRNDDVGAFYTAIGTALHPGGAEKTPALVEQSLREAGLPDAQKLSEVALDPAADAAVKVAHERALELVGEDVGSPIIITAAGNAIFGPVVSPVPKGDDAVAIWEASRTLADIATFHELKRGRGGGPDYS